MEKVKTNSHIEIEKSSDPKRDEKDNQIEDECCSSDETDHRHTDQTEPNKEFEPDIVQDYQQKDEVAETNDEVVNENESKLEVNKEDENYLVKKDEELAQKCTEVNDQSNDGKVDTDACPSVIHDVEEKSEICDQPEASKEAKLTDTQTDLGIQIAESFIQTLIFFI